MTDGLGAEEAGLTLDRGFIAVDELFRTTVPGISAIGDVITIGDRPASAARASVVGRRAFWSPSGSRAATCGRSNYDHVPACTYCDPEIGSVGLTEAEAAARGFDVRVGTFPFSALGRARIAGETEGFVKIVGETEYDQLLGVHIIGPRATELVGRSRRGAAARVHGRRADPHHPRAPDDVGSDRRGRAWRSRRHAIHI